MPIKFIGSPTALGFAFYSDKFNVYCLEDILKSKNWDIKCLQYPTAIGFNITL